ncbi:MAG: diaminopimelate decarboxylase [Chloroflexota bacterium]|nr:diaminopimelate decarboxylase [Chloroflexota bacterium]
MTLPSTELPPFLTYRQGRLYFEELALEELAAQFGTPVYIYSTGALRAAYHHSIQPFRKAGLDLSLCYAIRANSNLNIIRLFGEMGAGASVVSGGELYRALQAGINPTEILFAGVGKSADEMDYALTHKIGGFNVESASELALLERRAIAVGQKARVTLRVNLDEDVGTQPYTTTRLHHTKFGIRPTQALDLAHYAAQSDSLSLVGLQMYCGSPLVKVEPTAFTRLLSLATQLEAEGIPLEQLDLGESLGITPLTEEPELAARELAALLKAHGVEGKYRLLSEPSRYLTANAGVLLTTLLYLKQDEVESLSFAIVDTDMKPALYGDRIVPLHQRLDAPLQVYEAVGSAYDNNDFLGKGLLLPELKEGDGLAVLGAGAYGFSRAYNYNSRLRPPEILVDEYTARLIRYRESYKDLILLES